MSGFDLTPADRAAVAAVREAAALFALPARGVIAVSGDDRVRWLDGMLSNDVKQLAVGRVCRALLLTPQGRIVAELYVLALADQLLLETERAAVADVIARLERYVIADDVVLADRSDAFARLALEGPRAGQALAAAGDGSAGELAAGAHEARQIAGERVLCAGFSLVAATGASGAAPAAGIQLFAPAAAAARVAAALEAADGGAGLVRGSAAALDCARVEAGRPWPGRELDESVLPAEARVDDAISTTKGCYTGQEVVARMRSRGRASHTLVSLRFESGPPQPRTPLLRDGREVGELTSSALSPRLGAIGLGYVRAEHAQAGVAVEADGIRAQVLAPDAGAAA